MREPTFLPPANFVILLILAKAPLHGYAIARHELIGKLDMPMGPAKLYETLHSLSVQNYIEELPFGGRRKQYRLTKKGWDALKITLPAYVEIASQTISEL